LLAPCLGGPVTQKCLNESFASLAHLQEAVLIPPSSKPSAERREQLAAMSRSSSVEASGSGGGGSSRGGVLALLLSEDGDFVRDILLDELAKVGGGVLVQGLA